MGKTEKAIGREARGERWRAKLPRIPKHPKERFRAGSAKVELRPKEEDPEEQRQNADAVRLGLHVLTKTKLKQEWLRGQENDFLPGGACLQLIGIFSHPKC